MTRYQNYSGSSAVFAYDIGPDYIDVRFNNGGVYRYTNNRTGPQHVEQMKRLAQRGTGLSSYINTYVKHRYASRTV